LLLLLWLEIKILILKDQVQQNSTKVKFKITPVENKRIENLEIEIKNKIEKIRNFNPQTCYVFSDLNEEQIDYTASPEVSVISRTPQKNASHSFPEKNNHLLDSRQIANKNITSKKIFFFKKLIRSIDILVSILILIGCILSQIEDEFFYSANLQDRVGVVKLMRYIKYNGVPVDFSPFNISYMNNTDFVKKINFSDYDNIPLTLEIPAINANIRYILTILTIICAPCIVFGRYIEYLREEIYKRNLESKLIFLNKLCSFQARIFIFALRN
jgi:hypothetical protein